MKERIAEAWRFNIGTVVSFLAMAIGGTAFVYQNFQTDAKAKEDKAEIMVALEKLDKKTDKVSDKVDVLLQRRR